MSGLPYPGAAWWDYAEYAEHFRAAGYLISVVKRRLPWPRSDVVLGIQLLRLYGVDGYGDAIQAQSIDGNRYECFTPEGNKYVVDINRSAAWLGSRKVSAIWRDNDLVYERPARPPLRSLRPEIHRETFIVHPIICVAIAIFCFVVIIGSFTADSHFVCTYTISERVSGDSFIDNYCVDGYTAEGRGPITGGDLLFFLILGAIGACCVRIAWAYLMPTPEQSIENKWIAAFHTKEGRQPPPLEELERELEEFEELYKDHNPDNVPPLLRLEREAVAEERERNKIPAHNEWIAFVTKEGRRPTQLEEFEEQEVEIRFEQLKPGRRRPRRRPGSRGGGKARRGGAARDRRALKRG